jgi:hypothetical protein
VTAKTPKSAPEEAKNTFEVGLDNTMTNIGIASRNDKSTGRNHKIIPIITAQAHVAPKTP